MNNENIRFRAGPLPDDFIQTLAKFGHMRFQRSNKWLRPAFCVDKVQRCDRKYRPELAWYRNVQIYSFWLVRIVFDTVTLGGGSGKRNQSAKPTTRIATAPDVSQYEEVETLPSGAG